MTPEQFNFLVNAGVAGLFAIFAIMLFDRFNKFLENQMEQWRGFLEAEREAREKSANRFSEQISAISTELAKVSMLLGSHDQRVEKAIPEMREALEREKSKPIKRGT